MKKITYLLAILLVAFASCTPLEDIHREIDALPEDPNIGTFEYELTDEDYKSLDLSFGNFSSEADAKEALPDFLAEKYALYGGGSSVNVTFKLYSPKLNEKSLAVYEVTNADYTAQGLRFPNFSSFSQIEKFLNTKYPNPDNRLLVSLTYDYYNGSVSTLNSGFIYVDGNWEMATGITTEEYSAMGEGRPQFSSENEAFSKIPVFMNDKFKYDAKEAGDVEGIMYKLYVTDEQDIDGDGKTNDKAVYSFVAFFIYDGVNWSKYSNVIKSSVKFGHDGTKWVPDNTIRYTFTDADYAYIGTEFANETGYVEAAASVLRYSNFDRRPKGSAYWSDEMLLNAAGKLLDNNDPTAVEDQQYVLIFSIYDGNSGVEELKLIKKAGKWVKN
ncbi:hypothetical protein [Tenacibaculum maritimum]|uniref:hypothetical protein n=1 Tax=Tenacibaculum maritimum TaxID=107401 RepID=UPI003876A726